MGEHDATPPVVSTGPTLDHVPSLASGGAHFLGLVGGGSDTGGESTLPADDLDYVDAHLEMCMYLSYGEVGSKYKMIYYSL